jgi:hypothetical protein
MSPAPARASHTIFSPGRDHHWARRSRTRANVELPCRRYNHAGLRAGAGAHETQPHYFDPSPGQLVPARIQRRRRAAAGARVCDGRAGGRRLSGHRGRLPRPRARPTMAVTPPDLVVYGVTTRGDDRTSAARLRRHHDHVFVGLAARASIKLFQSIRCSSVISLLMLHAVLFSPKILRKACSQV